MSYRTEKNPNGETDIVISGFENGIASSPHKGIANLQGVNLSTETGEVMCSFNRTQQAQTIQGTGTLTVTSPTTFTVTNVTLLPGSWIHIVSDSGTGLSGDYYYMGSGMFSSTFSRDTSSAVTGGATQVFLTSGTTWSVPSGWDNASNTIETLGGAGAGAKNGTGGSGSGGGGGGGAAYSKISNLTLTPSGTVTYAVGAGGAANTSGAAGNGGDTYFNGASLGASSVGAKGGGGGVSVNAGASGTGSGGAGGASGSGIGTTKYSGGNGGEADGTTLGGGGGGAAGPNGAGANAVTSAGGAADNGSGGAGGIGGSSPTAGAAGAEFDATHGCGGGGGGAQEAGGQKGANGGNYGGASGGSISGSNASNPGKQGLIVINYTALGATATFTVYTMGKPIMSSYEIYTDDSGVKQYRYYILDDTGRIWVHDTASPLTLPNPAWASLMSNPTLSGRTPSGLAILNGWLTYALDDMIYWKPTAILSAQFATGTVKAQTKTFHATLVGSQGKMYYTDGNFIGSVFPNASLISGAANLQSYFKYTAVTTTGTLATLIGGSYPNLNATPAIRVPIIFITIGTLATDLTADYTASGYKISQVYYVKWLNSGATFEVYAAATGGSALDIQTGAVGTQYADTFSPLNLGGQSMITFTPQRLNLPFYETAQCMAELGNTVVIGGIGNILYPWDQVSALPFDLIFLPENNTVKIVTVNNSGYVFAGQKGNIYITNGSSASRVLKVPDYCAGVPGTPATYYEPYFSWGDAMYVRGRVWFSILDQTATKVGNCGGIWSFIPSQNITGDDSQSLRLENQSSYATYNGLSTVLLPSQTQTAIAPQYWNGWYSSITSPTYGIDFTDTITTPSAVIETELIPTGILLNKKTFQQIEYKLASPLASGESVTIKYRKNGTEDWTSCGTIITEGDTELSGYYKANFQDTQWLQLQITLTPLASSSSTFVRLYEIRVR